MQTNLPQDTRGAPIFMVVATVGSIPEASLIAGRLRSLGIPAFIHTEGILPTLGLTTGSRVLVPQEYYEAAQCVLEPLDEMDWLDDGEAPDADAEL
jgi:hypothetical protein